MFKDSFVPILGNCNFHCVGSGETLSRGATTKFLRTDFINAEPCVSVHRLEMTSVYVSPSCKGVPNFLFGIRSRFILPGSNQTVSNVLSAFQSSGCRSRNAPLMVSWLFFNNVICLAKIPSRRGLEK